MAGMLRVPRSRGALSGTLLVLLGAWGGLIPFIGPYFHYAYAPDTAWTYSSGRMWLEVLPGAATLVGGLIVLASRSRPVAVAGAWLAALSGGWFAVGGILGPLWMKGGAAATGTPVGGTVARVAEQIGFFTGLGVVIAFIAALALGRFTVVGVRDAKLAARDARLAARDKELTADEPKAPVGAGAPVTTAGPVTASGPADGAKAAPASGPAGDAKAAPASGPAGDAKAAPASADASTTKAQAQADPAADPATRTPQPATPAR